MTEPILTTNAEVASALADGRPLVALESTIITHGMPYPENAETALGVETVVRDAGAVPATVAVVAGRARVGLAPDEIDALGRAGAAKKVSRRDLPFAMASGSDGGTTVAATMLLARRAGIRVFATGGIGGVHRGATTTFDISADLQELAITEVAVVCSGMKSMLDVPRTLEYLETHGVPVIGYRTGVVPGFYCRESDSAVDYRLDSAAEVAAVIAIRERLGLRGGLVITNPVPTAHGMPREVIDAHIETALQECQSAGVAGKNVTPFLLARVAELTGRASLAANIALVRDNARVAAGIAAAVTEATGRVASTHVR
jgi:pseudouridine-5'-phosphate glycosidase